MVQGLCKGYRRLQSNSNFAKDQAGQKCSQKRHSMPSDTHTQHLQGALLYYAERRQ